jgi:hypothetical protein
MADPKPETESAKRQKKRPVGESTLKSSGEVVLRYEKTAAKAPEGKRIHSRRPLPLVPDAPSQKSQEKTEGKREADQSGSDAPVAE